MRRRSRVPDDGNPRELGDGCFEQLQTLGHRLTHDDSEPRSVGARARETGHVAAADWVRVAHEDDGNRSGRSLGRPGVDGRRRDDEIDLEADEVLHQAREPVKSPFGPAVFDDDVLTLDPAEIAQTLPKRFERMRPHGRAIPDKSDAIALPSLLRPYGQRRGEKTAGQGRKKCSARAHSITSSALSGVGGACTLLGRRLYRI